MTYVNARRWLAPFIALCAVLAATAATASAVGVTPASISQSADPGDTIGPITKTVTTPVVPPNPDIVFLVDTTGSMGSTIANVQTGLANILSTVSTAQPTAQFAVAEYGDTNDGPPCTPFSVDQNLTANQTDVTNAINGLAPCNGGDTPEDWINALYEIGNGAVSFRPNSTRFVVLVGDASSHDPSDGHTLADATAALTAQNINVLAIDVNTGAADGLDATGQATSVATTTGGQYATGSPDQASAMILAALTNQPVEVTHQLSACDANLSVSLTPASITVTSGDDAVFSETIVVGAGAPQGTTISCTVEFLVNGESQGITQSIDITINDVTPPVTSCVQGPNPGGKIPKAGNNPASGQNPDGFYSLLTSDLVDPNATVTVTDSGSGYVFGPFPSGTNIKYVQAASGPSITPGSGAVNWKITGTGDALVTGTDASGNSSSATCLVPKPPK